MLPEDRVLRDAQPIEEDPDTEDDQDWTCQRQMSQLGPTWSMQVFGGCIFNLISVSSTGFRIFSLDEDDSKGFPPKRWRTRWQAADDEDDDPEGLCDADINTLTPVW